MPKRQYDAVGRGEPVPGDLLVKPKRRRKGTKFTAPKKRPNPKQVQLQRELVLLAYSIGLPLQLLVKCLVDIFGPKNVFGVIAEVEVVAVSPDGKRATVKVVRWRPETLHKTLVFCNGAELQQYLETAVSRTAELDLPAASLFFQGVLGVIPHDPPLKPPHATFVKPLTVSLNLDHPSVPWAREMYGLLRNSGEIFESCDVLKLVLRYLGPDIPEGLHHVLSDRSDARPLPQYVP